MRIFIVNHHDFFKPLGFIHARTGHGAIERIGTGFIDKLDRTIGALIGPIAGVVDALDERSAGYGRIGVGEGHVVAGGIGIGSPQQ